MKKTVVLLYPQFSEYELSCALSILMQGGKPIITAGLTKRLIKGESGLSCVADTVLEDVDVDEIDSILLPGCMDIGTLLEEQRLFDFIEHAATEETVAAAISSSVYLLAKAGVLKGKSYTAGLTEEAIDKLGVFEKALFSEEKVVQDGNIITAIGSGFVRFGVCFGKALNLDFDEGWYQE